MGVRDDCRHYIMQTVRGGDRLERCRLGVANGPMFACPDDCLFHEPRSVSRTGWAQGQRPRPQGKGHDDKDDPPND